MSEKEVEYKITEKLKQLGWEFDFEKNKKVLLNKIKIYKKKETELYDWKL